MGREATNVEFFAVHGGLPHAQLDAVILSRIMRSGDHAAAIGVQMEEGKVEHGVGTRPISTISQPVACSPLVSARQKDSELRR
jgi:hypothetical protein